MKPEKSCLLHCLKWAAVTMLTAAVLSVAALGYAGHWLRLIEQPRAADAIIVLAGSFERSLYAADLYRQQFAPRIYLSIPAREPGNEQIRALGIELPDQVEIHRQILRKRGVPAENIRTFGSNSLSTAEEAEVLKNLFASEGVHLLVVTSPYHARRAQLVLQRAFDGSKSGVTVVATPYEEYRNDWWRSQDSARKTLLELAKLAYYYAGGRFRFAQ